MKSILLIFGLTLLSTFGFGQNNSPTAPIMSFDTTTHDFGILPEGPVGNYDFWFTNTGKEPLIIRDAVGSCGCTTAEWPKVPVAPGERSKITAHYKTEGYPGSFKKTIYIASNAKSEYKRIELYIRGEVAPKPKAETTSDMKAVEDIPVKGETPKAQGK